MALSPLGEGGRLIRRGAVGSVLIGGAVLLGACRQTTAPLDPEVYIEVMAHLSYAHGRFIDAPRADSARQAVLDSTGVSPVDLRAFADFYGDDPEIMFAVAEQIRFRVDSLEAIERGEIMGGAEDALPGSGAPVDPDEGS